MREIAGVEALKLASPTGPVATPRSAADSAPPLDRRGINAEPLPAAEVLPPSERHVVSHLADLGTPLTESLDEIKLGVTSAESSPRSVEGAPDIVSTVEPRNRDRRAAEASLLAGSRGEESYPEVRISGNRIAVDGSADVSVEVRIGGMHIVVTYGQIELKSGAVTVRRFTTPGDPD